MAHDGVDTNSVPVPIDRDHGHGPQRGGGVLEATSLCRQRERETLQCQLDLVHAHVELNGGNIDEEESQDEE